MAKQNDYIRFSDLSVEEQEKFKVFLGKTARSFPIIDGEGDCSWRTDYEAFARGADPYAGLRVSEKYAEKLGER